MIDTVNAYVHSFPDVLTFVATDGDGNRREVMYYRADLTLSFSAKVEDIFHLPKTLKQNWKAEEPNTIKQESH